MEVHRCFEGAKPLAPVDPREAKPARERRAQRKMDAPTTSELRLQGERETA